MFEDTGVWIAGHNMTGYLPESSPGVYETWEGARDSLLWELGDNGLADYYAQGLEQVWLDLYNEYGDTFTVTVMEALRAGHIPSSESFGFDDIQMQTLMNLIETETLIDQLKNLDVNDVFYGTVEYRSYWLDTSSSLHGIMKDADLNPEEFDNVDEALEALSESGY